MSRGTIVWGDQGRAVQLAQWRKTLEAHEGNITRAGRALGLTKAYAFRVTRALGLSDYARSLRKAALGRDRGRPWDAQG